MAIIKFIITAFFLCVSYWIVYLIFNRNFVHAGMQFSADNWNENTFMILLISTLLSIAGVFFVGILSMFVHFVFIKLIYADEIKSAAYFIIKNRGNKVSKELLEYRENIKNIELNKLSFIHKIKKRISNWTNEL